MKKNIITAFLFLFEEFLHLVRGNNSLLESVGISFGRAYHADYLGITLASGGFKGCNNFLCHSSLSPIFI